MLFPRSTPHLSPLHRAALVALVALALAASGRATAQTVTFADPTLESSVRSTLGIPVAPITVPDMLTLTNLDAGWRSITNLSGLETARNLRTLYLSGNQLGDLSPLSGLTNLLSLQLAWNRILDATPVSTLTNLVLFDIGANRDPNDWNHALSNLTWLPNFHQLRSLGMYYINATNLALVAGLTGLTNLDASFLYRADHPSALSGLTNLQRLNVAANGLEDCAFMAAMPQLREADISYNAIPSLAPLLGRDLVGFWASYCGLADATLVTNFPSLTRLFLAANNLDDAGFLTSLTNLQELALDSNNLTDFSPLTALANLGNLNVGHNPASNWPDLLSLPHLGSLEIFDLGIYDLTPLAGAQLWRLNLNGNLIADTSPLRTLPNLGELYLQNNQLVNLDPLLAASSLWYVDLRQNLLDVYDPLSPAMQAIQQLQNHASVEYLPQARTTTIVVDTNPQDLCLASGATAIFNVAAHTTETFLDYQWQRDGMDLPGETYDSLTLTNITLLEAGRYRCLLFDDAGRSCSEEAVLFVDDAGCGSPITISEQPRSQCAAPDETVSFEVVAATSNTDLFYQWQRNGADIPDATDATLDLFGVSTSDSGLYRVRLEDDTGAIKYSLPADLMVVEEVTFPDSGLDNRVRQSLGLAPGDPISLATLDNLYWLDASWSGLTSLAGLECARNIEWLSLVGNPGITNWSVLRRVVSLRELYLNQCSLTSANFLAPLTDLERLELNDNQLQTVTPLAGLTNLYWLQVNWNGCLTGLDALAGLTQVTGLGIAGSCAENLAFTQPMSGLSWLAAPGNTITDFSPLADKWWLDYLDLSWNQITNFSLAASLTNLQSLYAAGNGISNAAFIAPLQQLRSLALDNNPIPDLALVAGKTNLTYLNVSTVATTNMTPLTGLTNLETLYVGGNHLTSLALVTNMPRMWALGAWDNQVTSMTPLTGLHGLGYLNLDDNDVTNAVALTGKTNLTWAYLRNNALQDLTPLSSSTNLSSLNLEGNQLTQLAPLADKHRLDWLILGRNQLADLSPLAGLTNLVTLSLEANQITNLTPLAGLARLDWLQVRSNRLAALPSFAGLQRLVTFDAGFNRIADVSAVTAAPSLSWCRLEFNDLQDINALTNLMALTYLDVRRNLLNTNTGSAAMTAVAQMQNRGVWVDYVPQKDAASGPVLVNPVWLPDNQFQFTLTSTPGAAIEILRAGAATGPWASAGWVTNTTGTTNYTDPSPPPAGRFYRARQP